MADSANTWTTDAPRINDPETLARFKKMLEIETPLIIEHKFYRGGRGPHYFVADDYEDLLEYLQTKTRPGDKFTVWHFSQCCRDDNVLVSGKYPDDDGKVPLGGPY
jgi:hypothetical protein